MFIKNITYLPTMRYSIVFLTLAACITVNAAPLTIRDDALPSFDQASVAATPTTTEEVPSAATPAVTEAPTILESETGIASLTTESPTEGDDPRTLDPNFWSTYYAGYPIDSDGRTLTVPTTFDPWDRTWSDFGKEFYITHAPDGFEGDLIFAIEVKKDQGSEEEGQYVEAIPTDLV